MATHGREVGGRRRPAGERTAVRDRLVEADLRVEALQQELDRQTRLVQDVEHRAKNTLQVVTSLVLLKARRAGSPEAAEALHSLADRIGAVTAAHRLLSAAVDASRLDFGELVASLAEDVGAGLEPDRLTLAVAVEPVSIPAAKADPLALLLNELMTNAVRHAFPEGRQGRVAVRAALSGGALRLVVEDDGIGLEAVQGAPEGFGRTLVAMLVRQLKGTLAWEPAEPGTRAVVTVPLEANGS